MIHAGGTAPYEDSEDQGFADAGFLDPGDSPAQEALAISSPERGRLSRLLRAIVNFGTDAATTNGLISSRRSLLQGVGATHQPDQRTHDHCCL